MLSCKSLVLKGRMEQMCVVILTRAKGKQEFIGFKTEIFFSDSIPVSGAAACKVS